MEQQTLKKAELLVGRIIHAFYCDRNIEEMLSFLSEDATWIGPGENEYKTNKQEMAAYFQEGLDAVPSCSVYEEDFHAVSAGENACLVTGRYMVCSDETSGMLVKAHQRASFFITDSGDALTVQHMHISNPYGEMEGEDYFPQRIGRQSYEYLQEKLNEKNEMLDMIASNISGGLKGSNDDNTFSYFYVNEGLPRMLGYTYDEFMKYSGGTAVGAVYEPDLPKALADCEACFAKGPAYSTEYRMRKKDGSLMWVMDSGRKAKDAGGVTKINSILMDITPLKTALSELEIERERYRIALQNITDVMYEYDINKDLYTTFQRIEIDGKIELERFEIAHFSKCSQSREQIHPDDWEKLFDVYCGNCRDTVEFRMKNSQARGKWRWEQIRCSVIYGNSHEPIRTIGTIKDITPEKEKEMELIERARRDSLTGLLNQAAAKKQAERYLLTKAAGESCALMILDLDHFKTVNDTLGHLFGNDILIGLSNIMKASIRQNDIVGRVGGDEFLILMKNVSRPIAERRLRSLMSEIRLYCGHLQIPVTCSIGVTVIEENPKTYNELFRQADNALYRAKGNGRNRFEFFE